MGKSRADIVMVTEGALYGIEIILALFAKDEGLALIYQLIDQLPAHLNPGALIFLEADPRQHGAIIAYAGSRQLRHKLTRGFIVVLQA